MKPLLFYLLHVKICCALIFGTDQSYINAWKTIFTYISSNLSTSFSFSTSFTVRKYPCPKPTLLNYRELNNWLMCKTC